MKLLQLSKIIYNWGAEKAVDYIFMFFTVKVICVLYQGWHLDMSFHSVTY